MAMSAAFAVVAKKWQEFLTEEFLAYLLEDERSGDVCDRIDDAIKYEQLALTVHELEYLKYFVLDEPFITGLEKVLQEAYALAANYHKIGEVRVMKKPASASTHFTKKIVVMKKPASASTRSTKKTVVKKKPAANKQQSAKKTAAAK